MVSLSASSAWSGCTTPRSSRAATSRAQTYCSTKPARRAWLTDYGLAQLGSSPAVAAASSIGGVPRRVRVRRGAPRGADAVPGRRGELGGVLRR
ncbi:Os04g0169000 [Oryza sativa Japonica Group]|uniref:Os04g0169000 protein n=1 Tax=Oryza sativa subsp. japonica TaxID=39947 RepID=A0A0P0W7C8_ORYSJ|nr:hypothetical protein DAI22_04g026400 [Oryza sativa Japonica Group]BAS87895.1 Os04g0169000 [Oryza sativa Japonica Group]